MSKSTKVIAALGVVAGLGVAALPAFTYAASTSGNVELEVTVQPGIAMTIEGNSDGGAPGVIAEDPTGIAAAFNLGTIDAGPSSSKTTMTQNTVKEDMTSTIKVYTNNAGGYTLTVEDQDSVTALKSGSNAINAISTPAASLTGGQGVWGLKGGDLGDNYTGVPANGTPLTVVAAGLQNNSGDTTVITYGVSTSAAQAQGVYTDTIVYTATTKQFS